MHGSGKDVLVGVGSEGIMRILKNIYGSTAVPGGLWLAWRKKLVELGAQPALGERCPWIWLSEYLRDGDHAKVIGAMGGRVDDFRRIGDNDSEEWTATKGEVDKAYKWGTIKPRPTGTLAPISRGWWMRTVIRTINYIEGIMDIEIKPERLRQEGPLTKREIDACRATLGAPQCFAIQSQPQLSTRCNLLLAETVTHGRLVKSRR